MACCGNKKKTGAKAGNIIKGYSRLAIDELLRLSEEKCEMTYVRINMCRGCEDNTWLSAMRFAAWVSLHAASQKTLDLDKLPALPKEPKGKGKKLFCRICKCFVPAKVRAADEKCPKGRW